MRHRQPGYNHRFRCIGGSCPDTCCRDWEIEVDREALRDYQAAPAGLRERIAGALTTGEDGTVCFRLVEDGRCALLSPEGLCLIQRDWGEAHLCGHCAAYPRFTEEYGCLAETALALSCPEAARLLMEAEPFALEQWDDGGGEPPFDGVDGALLAALEATRARALALMGEGESPLWHRLARLLELAARCQARLERGQYGPLARCRPGRGTGRGSGGFQALGVRLLETLGRLEPLRPQWPALLGQTAARLSALGEQAVRWARAGLERDWQDWDRHLTNLACYLIFRHWPKAVNDGLLYGRAALAGAGCLAVYQLMLGEWLEQGKVDRAGEQTFWTAFGREVEHLEDNLAALIQALSHRRIWPLAPAFWGAVQAQPAL